MSSAVRPLVLLAVAAPVVLAALIITAFETRGVRTSGENAITPAPFPEAVRNGDLDAAFAHLRAGHDPNDFVRFRDAELTGGVDVRVTPLVIAIAAQQDDALMMLMSFGARLDAPGNAYARCLATRLSSERVTRILLRDGGAAVATERCPDAPIDPAHPLLALGASTPAP